MRNDRRGSGGRGRPPRGRGRERKPIDFEGVDDGYDDDGYDDEDDRPSRRRSRPSRGKSAAKGKPKRGGLFGRGGKSSGKGGFDWDAVDDDGYDEEDDYDEPPRRSRRRSGGSSRRPARQKRVGLMELCTPVFGYAAVLPQDPSGEHPSYQQFRQEVVGSLHRIETEAVQHGIEAEDARQAGYALSLFMDTRVAGSGWNAKGDWAAEPLGIMLHQDPEGGVNFFKHLETFREDQKELKEVYLVCLALGFRGRFAEMELNQQATQIAEEKQRLLRQIHPVPLEKQSELFPAAYREAHSIEDEVPPPPRWWVFTSIGVVLAAILIWVLLFWVAGRTPVKPSQELEQNTEIQRPVPTEGGAGMKELLIRLGIPVASISVLFGGVFASEKAGWIPEPVAFWLWPSLIALLLLAGAIVALLKGARLVMIPLAVGFLVQGVGLILLMVRKFESRWEPLWYTLGAIVVVLLLMLLVWGINTLRARALERGIAAGLGPEEGTSEQELERIRQDMLKALDLLKRAGRGRNAIYGLPWFLVMGRPSAGKTVAIKESGLGLPVRKDWVKGVGGTYTADWFFTNEMIFLDTPGKWVTDGADSGAQDYWKQLMRLLKKYRGRQPLDGLVVVVPADDLLSKSPEDLEEQAANVREVIDLIHSELSFRFPVYLLVTKCDLVEGFIDFFRGVPAQRRHEILGWSNDDPNNQNLSQLIAKGCGYVRKRLASYRLEMLAKEASRSKARRLFFFPEEFKELQDPLSVFADALFAADRFHDTPVFRGFYFSSGTQGEGSPLSRAMPALARALGVSSVQGDQEEEGPKRSYFLLDLFRDLMVKDEGLVSRTAVHWWKRRRNTMLGAFAPAGIALLLLLLSGLSLILNRGLYHEVADEAPKLQQQLRQLQGDLDPDNLTHALSLTEELRTYHRKLDGFSVFRGFGMRRPGALEGQTFDLFREGFEESVLRPTLSAAEAVARDSELNCAPRLEVLHSVVWLRMGRRVEAGDDLSGFEQVWNFEARDQEKSEAAQENLLRQYGYYKTVIDRQTNESLLPGFSVLKVADSLRRDCSSEGDRSTLEMYRRFQQECRGSDNILAVLDCYKRLSDVWRHSQADYDRFVRRFGALKADLAQLTDREPEARIGLEKLDAINLAEVSTAECLVDFEQTLVPLVREFAERDDLLQSCQEAVAAKTALGEKYAARDQILKTQEERFADVADRLQRQIGNYNFKCDSTFQSMFSGFRGIEFDVLQAVSEQSLRERCLPMAKQPVKSTPAVAVGTKKPSSGGSRPSGRGVRFDLFDSVPAVSSTYRPANWSYKHQDWQAQLQSAQTGFSDAQRSAEERRIQGEARAFGRNYAKAWESYLGRLQMKSNRPGLADWLTRLATTQDFVKAIGPVVEAVDLGETASQPPFDGVSNELRPFASMQSFLDSGLAQYQALLNLLAEDLRRCESDNAFFRDYRSAVRSGDQNNNLVKARNWVQVNAGSALAGGKLQRFLMQPIESARGFVQSDSLVKGMWSELVTRYQDEIAGRAPFSGEIEGSEPADTASVVALLGQESGLVSRIGEAAGSGELTAAAAAWIARAQGLSDALFEPGTDRLKPVRVRVTVGETVFEPADFGEKARVDRVQIYFGDGSNFDWEPDGLESQTLRVMLFGDEAMEYSWIRGSVVQKKGRLRRMIGSDWKEGESLEAAAIQGPWAPLRVIEAGLAGGSISGTGDADLKFTFTVELKKGNTAQAITSVQASSRDLPVLMSVMRNGLAAPPSSLAGE